LAGLRAATDELAGRHPGRRGTDRRDDGAHGDMGLGDSRHLPRCSSGTRELSSTPHATVH
jgi:hypothetical protein